MVPNFKKRIFVELSILAGVVFIMGGTLFYFARSLGVNSDAIVNTRKMLMSRSQSLENFADSRITWNEKGKAYLENLRNVIPLKDQLITLGKDFQFLAGRARLEFSYTPIGETVPTPPNLGFIQFRVSVEGDYDSVQKYITTLQSFRYLTAIDGVSLTRTGNTFQALLSGRTFYR
ncbi:MAG: hypothetical protein AAB631_02820 [Patescibacteria group bacterium]